MPRFESSKLIPSRLRLSPISSPVEELFSAVFAIAAIASRAAGFEAPTYMADNRWCDDWDYTCTVGYTVEDTQSAAKEAATTAGRRASASGQRAPTRY